MVSVSVRTAKSLKVSVCANSSTWPLWFCLLGRYSKVLSPSSSSFSSFCFIFPHHPSHDCVLRRWVSLHFCGEFIAVHRDLCHTPYHHPPPQRRGRAPLQEDINYDMSIKKLASHIEMEEGNACFALSVTLEKYFHILLFCKYWTILCSTIAFQICM